MVPLLMTILTETRQRIKPSDTIWPAMVATRDALCPAERSAKAKMAAAPSEELNEGYLAHTKQLTPPNDVANSRMGIVDIGGGNLNTRLVEDSTG
jgi:hypothetical protein